MVGYYSVKPWQEVRTSGWKTLSDGDSIEYWLRFTFNFVSKGSKTTDGGWGLQTKKKKNGSTGRKQSEG